MTFCHPVTWLLSKCLTWLSSRFPAEPALPRPWEPASGDVTRLLELLQDAREMFSEQFCRATEATVIFVQLKKLTCSFLDVFVKYLSLLHSRTAPRRAYSAKHKDIRVIICLVIKSPDLGYLPLASLQFRFFIYEVGKFWQFHFYFKMLLICETGYPRSDLLPFIILYPALILNVFKPYRHPTSLIPEILIDGSWPT